MAALAKWTRSVLLQSCHQHTPTFSRFLAADVKVHKTFKVNRH